LSRYTALAANRLRFGYGLNGKPYLASEGTDGGLRFNLSHAEELALIGVTRDVEIGVDLEYRRVLDDLDGLARTSFAPREREMLFALPESQWIEAFYNCWTRKEAFIKAIGDGMSYPLADFVVSLAPGAPSAILDGGRVDSRGWSMFSPEPAPGYTAAIAVIGADWRLQSMNAWPNAGV
jgi:4'-phosphopantetheinyl transferase